MSVYILYYHRISSKAQPLCASFKLFNWEMAYLKKHYQVLSLNELLEYINGDLTLNKPGVAITFDDGWFDNFVYAYPVIRKHGLKATIFVSTGKMRQGESVRPTLEDCWSGRRSIDDLQHPKGVEEGFLDSLSGDLREFLTWEELRVMQKSGVFDVQSHGVEHRKVFCSDEASGAVKGKVSWSVLSASPGIKEGMPLYPIRSALAARSYYPFFSGASGRWETEEEMRSRVLGELAQSRDRIYSEIGVKPLHFCWPWGQYIDLGIELAKEAGYAACYTTKAGSVAIGTDRYSIPRVSTKGGRLTFIKRGFVYSNPYISKVYGFLRERS